MIRKRKLYRYKMLVCLSLVEKNCTLSISAFFVATAALSRENLKQQFLQKGKHIFTRTHSHSHDDQKKHLPTQQVTLQVVAVYFGGTRGRFLRRLRSDLTRSLIYLKKELGPT